MGRIKSSPRKVNIMKDFCCPNCGTTNEFEEISDLDISYYNKTIRRYFLCGGCGSQFMAEYTLTNIVALEELKK